MRAVQKLARVSVRTVKLPQYTVSLPKQVLSQTNSSLEKDRRSWLHRRPTVAELSLLLHYGIRQLRWWCHYDHHDDRRLGRPQGHRRRRLRHLSNWKIVETREKRNSLLSVIYWVLPSIKICWLFRKNKLLPKNKPLLIWLKLFSWRHGCIADWTGADWSSRCSPNR